ncbi:MAG: glycosyltransferase family 4 protein [Candidatus Omnitrophota bacterium]
MKVYHLITRLIIGGAQENTLFTCYQLASRGHDVVLLTGPALGPEGSLLEDARAHSLKIFLIPFLRRQINPFYDLPSLLAIRRILLRERPDILHTHSTKAGILGRMAAGIIPHRPKVVHTVHGLPFHPYQNRLLNNFYITAEKMVAPFTDAYISVAEAMTTKNLASGVGKKEQYSTVYSAFPVEEFVRARQYRKEVRRRYGFQENDIVIGKIARLFHLKGHEFLLPAFQAVRKEFPQSKLFLVGDGILRPELERMAESLGIRDAVVFAGLLPPEEIPRLVSALDLLVHVSLREGLPKAVAQALASGVPVVASDVDGTKEVVIDGITGYLVPPKDTPALSSAILSSLRNPEKSRIMAQTGQKFIRENFTVEKMTARIEEIYLLLCHSRML